VQKKMQKIQPEIKKIQAENKKEPQKQTSLLLEVYKNNKINPSFAFFFAFIQIFIIFGLFSAFSVATKPGFIQYLYPFIHNIINPAVSYSFLG
jgi:membrane protein insertase Oxa1/YidC/SpoIIIJ